MDEQNGAFQGPIGFVDTPTGDGRVIDSSGFSWRTLPLTLMAQFSNEEGHKGAVIVGKLTDIWIENTTTIMGRGVFSDTPDGQRARAALADGSLRGVSMDLADVEIDFESDPNMIHFKKCKVGALTMTPVPAFGDAVIALVASADNYLVSFDFNPEVADCECSFATKIPIEPPIEWFSKPKLGQVTPLVVERSGRVYGHVAEWGACHIGYGATCKEVPRCGTYRKFMNKSVECVGGLAPTGPIVIGTNHADRFAAADVAQDHYAHTGAAVADVSVYEDEFGLVVAGALRPDVTGAQVRVLRGSDISPDWRKVRTLRNHAGKWELVGLLSVNTSGFLSDSLLASGEEFEDMEFENVSEPIIGIDDSGLVSFIGGNIVFRSKNDIVLSDSSTGSENDLEVKEPVVAKIDSVEVEVVPVLSEGFVASLRKAVEDVFTDVLESFKTPVTLVVEATEELAAVEIVEDASVAVDTELSDRLARVEENLAVVAEFVNAQRAAMEAQALKDEFGSKFGI